MGADYKIAFRSPIAEGSVKIVNYKYIRPVIISGEKTPADNISPFPEAIVVDGVYNHPDGTTAQTVIEFDPAIQDISISFDMSMLAKNVRIREYEKVDGTNYQEASNKIYPTQFDPNTKDVIYSFKQKNKGYKITFTSLKAEGAIKAIPFTYRIEPK